MEAGALEGDGVGVGREGRASGGPRPDLSHEVVAADDLAVGVVVAVTDRRVGRITHGVVGARAAELDVRVVDAGVQHRHPDTRTVHAGVLYGRCPDVGHGLGEIDLVVAEAPDAADVRQLGNVLDLRGVHGDRDRHQRLADAAQLATTHAPDPIHQLVLAVVRPAEVLPLLIPGHPAPELLVVPALRDHERRVGRLDDDLDLAGGRGQVLLDEDPQRHGRCRDRPARDGEARGIVSGVFRADRQHRRQSDAEEHQ
jgi:hypothetical protein